MAAAVAAQTAVIELGVKQLTRRARPGVQVDLRFGARRPGSSSMPSGHAANAVCGALLLAEGWRGARAPLLLLAAFVAWSRVQLGLHHASDVLAGAALGAVTAAVVRRAIPLSRG